MEIWTINKLLGWISQYLKDRGIESPRLHAELLLSHVLSLKRIELYTHHDTEVIKSDLEKLHALVKRAGLNEPVAYLVGKTEFYSIEIEVYKDCLIPRPETELLVQRAIEFLRTRDGIQSVCDLCTGSGCIAVAIAKNFPQANIIATDISDQALKIANRNVEKFNLQERIKLLSGDLFDPVIPQLDTGKFDLIISNPPYVSETEYEKLDKNVKDYEPRIALFAGEDGLDVYKRIIEKADLYLKPKAALLLEIGYSQGSSVRSLLEKNQCFSEITIEKDFNDNDRIVKAVKQ